jgi:hypothetical protein
MTEPPRRRRRWVLYDPSGAAAAYEHALEVSALLRELQTHLDRARRGEASAQETAEVTAMVRAARRVQGGKA